MGAKTSVAESVFSLCFGVAFIGGLSLPTNLTYKIQDQTTL